MAAALMPFLMLGGGLMSAVGQISQANAAAGAANYNAQVMEQQAADVRRQTTARQETQRKEARQQIGQQLAATSESGAGLTGSNADLLGESLYNAELDALNIRYEGEQNARGMLAQAGLSRAEGKNARTAGYLSAAGTLLNSGASYISHGGRLPGSGRKQTYNNDASGMMYSRTGADIRARR